MKEDINEIEFIFLPGIPGRKKDFEFVADLRSRGLTVIEYRHPGLYEQDGEFSVSNTLKEINLMFKGMEKSKKPFVVISYSFSTIIMQYIDIEKYKYLKGVTMFSPVFGLGLDWINENIKESLDLLISTGDCHPDKNMEIEIENLKKPVYGFDVLRNFTKSGIPVGIFLSKNDTTINVKGIMESITQFRDLFGQGSLFVVDEQKGNHKIDTYYSESSRNLLLSFVAREQVRNLIGDDCHIFVWGSSQSTNFFKDRYSDIDLYIMNDNYLKYFKELSDLQLSFYSRFKIKLDLSINKYKDLQSERISRFNRGPLLAHSLSHLYFNLERDKIRINVDFEDVKFDCYKATLSIYRECEKQISRLTGSDEQVRWFAKLYTVAIFYLLHVRNNTNIDMNRLERWLDSKKDKKIIELLKISGQVLRGEKTILEKHEWYDLLESMRLMVVEEELLLNVVHKTYSLTSEIAAKDVDTPGKSMVIISELTKKVFKTYFLNSQEKIRDSYRVVQHFNQLNFLQNHNITVPSRLELVENNTAIMMDYVEGPTFDSLIKNRNPLLTSAYLKLVDRIVSIHSVLSEIKVNDKILINDDELNYHCARNFKLMSLPNFLLLGNTKPEEDLKFMAKMAAGIIEKYPKLLDSNDVIYGDLKPENIISATFSGEIYLLDPMLALGKVSCDIGRIISRTILDNPEVINFELFEFIKSIQIKYSKNIVEESQIMAALDMLNLISRMINTGDKNTKYQRIETYVAQLNNFVPALLKNVLWSI